MIFFIQTILSAVAYRLGGAGKEEIPFAQSWMRDKVIPFIMAWALLDRGGYIYSDYWLIGLSCLLLLGALSTYWDSIPFNKGKDNFYMHGAGIGVAMIPLYWTGIHWYSILAYAVALSASMGLLNYVVNKFPIPFKVWVEEILRGAFIILYIKILFI